MRLLLIVSCVELFFPNCTRESETRKSSDGGRRRVCGRLLTHNQSRCSAAVAALELAAKSLALYAAGANGATRRALDGDDAISHDNWVLKRLT